MEGVGGKENKVRALVSIPDSTRLVKNLDVKNNISRLSKQLSAAK